MSNFIRNLEIQNFKSIRSLQLDCKRINVFIGAPNVGKSNILEALALMGLTTPHIAGGLRDLVRFETMDNLFYDNRKNEVCSVTANEFMYQIRYNSSNNNYWWCVGQKKIMLTDMLKELFHDSNKQATVNQFKNHLHPPLAEEYKSQKTLIIPAIAYWEQNEQYWNMNLMNTYPSRIRKYHFSSQAKFDSTFNEYLLPVHGQNLFSILESNRDLMRLVAPMFHPYGLNLYWDDYKYMLAKAIDGAIRKYPFSLIADTLQRIIFYLAAIHTNNDAVLIFEEPEAHFHAAYIKDLADSIIASERNQFFFATHSPYLLQHLMENTPTEELAVFAVSFDTKEYTTKAKALTHEEIHDIVSYGTDVFFNMERYLSSESSSNGGVESHSASAMVAA